MNPPEHHVSAAIASYLSNCVAAKGICRVNADADNISCFNLKRIQRLQSLINQVRIAKACRCRGRQDVQPAWGDDSCTEGDFARINEMNTHSVAPSLGGLA